MGVSEMTHVSYFFAVMAAMFGCVSVAMYFMFDIRRCWKIVRGTHSVTVRTKAPAGVVSNSIVSNPIISNTEEKDYGSNPQKTEKLAPDKTETLFQFEETVPLETITLVQDIVMMTDVAMDADTERM